MDFRGSVVDAERADIAIDALDHGIVGDTHPAEHLKRSIDHAAERLGAVNLVHAGFLAGLLMLIEQPCGVPDREAAKIDVDLVVGEHKADALMFADGAAEGLPMAGVLQRDRMTAARRSQPAHAMGQARGGEADLRIAKALADFAEDAIAADAN